MGWVVIGVMGGGEGATERAVSDAYRLGELIAREGWALLTGGREAGVMGAATAGARLQGGLTIGILPDRDAQRASGLLDICIVTGMGDARNVINVLSSQVVIACGGGAGTISEIALAIKAGRPVILLNFDCGGLFDSYPRVLHASSPEEAIEAARQLIAHARPEC